MIENKSMKRKLIIQSFAPLFLILAIKNFTCELCGLGGRLAQCFEEQGWEALRRIPCHPLFLTCVLEVICVAWVVYAVASIYSFRNLQTANFRSQGEKLEKVQKISDSGVTFFVTYVLPMVLDDIGTLNGFLIFVFLMAMLCVLMWKTNLYYQNPVLTILGYNVISFEFDNTELRDFQNRECIGITKGDISAGAVIKRQYITDNVFLVYKNRAEGDGQRSS